MAVIRVIEPGMFTTVQDLGREGYGAMGVSPSGAADALSLRIGNRLAGNGEGAAGLEMTLVGGAFEFSEPGTIALTGADFAPSLDGVAVEMWRSCEVRAGQTLRMGGTRDGARGYLCVRGGIAVAEVMGSASTHVLSGMGGFAGRSLRRGDVLQVGTQNRANRLASGQAGAQQPCARSSPGKAAPLQGHGPRILSTAGRKLVRARKKLRVTVGPQSDWFGPAAPRRFYGNAYRVTEESNRMGLRLVGPVVEKLPRGEMISEGVALGAIQVPESGMPIILFVEQQTTGGYPTMANVISADFHSLGQLRPRHEITFQVVNWEMARGLLREQEELLASDDALFG
jgi:antagonist of KipI